MPNVKKNYVAVLPDGSESNHELWYYDDGRRQHNHREAAEQAVRDAGITTPRNAETRTVRVRVHELTIEKGALKRSHGVDFDITPPMARMTDDDYTRELAEALDGLPPEFAAFVSEKAYDDGHSAGYEEVVSLARGMAYSLKQAVDKYNARLKIK